MWKRSKISGKGNVHVTCHTTNATLSGTTLTNTDTAKDLVSRKLHVESSTKSRSYERERYLLKGICEVPFTAIDLDEDDARNLSDQNRLIQSHPSANPRIARKLTVVRRTYILIDEVNLLGWCHATRRTAPCHISFRKSPLGTPKEYSSHHRTSLWR